MTNISNSINTNTNLAFISTLDYARKELTRHLHMLDILYKEDQIALVADSDFTHNDSIHICVKNATGTIYGSNPRSVLIAVYTFLDKIGFRFVSPGKDGTIIPAITNTELIACDFQHTASLKHRGICIEGGNSAENVYDFIEWMPKVGFNSFFIQFKNSNTFLERYYKHIFNPYSSIEEADYDAINSRIDYELSLRGLSYHKVGHGWTCDVLGLNTNGWDTFDEKLPIETQVKMALLDGERKLHMGIPSNTNLCYSNITVQNEFSDIVVSYAKENINVDYLHVWLADEPNNICECENCQKDLLADQYIAILNLIDQKLTKENLNTKIVFLLYQELLYAPLRENFHNSERFTLMFAPISRTFKKSYPESVEKVTLPKYIRNKMMLPTNIEENLSYLSHWQDKFQGDSFVYDYPLGRAHYGDLGYVGIAKVINQDIKNLELLKLNGYISCQELRVSFPNTFPNYVMGKTLFDKEISFEELTLEYFTACYGVHSEEILAYLTTLSSLCDCDYINGKYEIAPPSTTQGFKEAFTLANEMEEKIKSLYQMHPDNTFFKVLSLHNQYCKLLLKSIIEKCNQRDNEADIYFTEFHKFICHSEVEFQSYFDVYRITEVFGKYTHLHPIES